jgi:hypothetical protein
VELDLHTYFFITFPLLLTVIDYGFNSNKGQKVTPTESVGSSIISTETNEEKLAREKYEEHYAKWKAVVEGDGKDMSGKKKRSSLAWLYEWIKESRS